jgi:hypothetical protein
VILIILGFALKNFFLEIKEKAIFESSIIEKDSVEILKYIYQDSFEINFKKIKRYRTYYSNPRIFKGICEYEIKTEGIIERLYISWETIGDDDPRILSIEKVDNKGKSFIIYKSTPG